MLSLSKHESTDDAPLIMRGDDENEIAKRLRDDPWGEDMLKLAWIRPWALRLGEL